MLRAAEAIPLVVFDFDPIDTRSETESSFPSDFVSRDFSNANQSPTLARCVRAQPHKPAIDSLSFANGIRRHIQIHHLQTMTPATCRYISVIIDRCTAWKFNLRLNLVSPLDAKQFNV
jgi:hypothetical protein